MASIVDGRATAAYAAIENTTKAQRVTIVPRTIRAYSLAASTGTMAAALGATSTVAALRLSPAAGSILAFVEKVRIQYTTIVAYTVPITAGRRLGLYRGAGAGTSGGTTISDFTQKDSTAAQSQCAVASGGIASVSTTAALTVAGITYETQPIAEMSLVHVGAAGAYVEHVFQYDSPDCTPICLQPGQLLGLRNIPAMDAAGTWAATITIDWFEALALSSSTADS